MMIRLGEWQGAEAIYDYLSTVNAERCHPPLPDAIIVSKATGG